MCRSLGYMRPLAIWGMHIALKGKRGESVGVLGEEEEKREIHKSSVLI